MEKNEHAIIFDVPNGGRDGRYHSAILTTYAIDLIHFDSQVLNMLHRKQICSVNVFADANQVGKTLEYISPRYLKNVGKDYSITSINGTGAFHPKINFFVGYESVLVVFGTGNLTVTGHGKNHEAFTGFMIDKTDQNHLPLIQECWMYLAKFTEQCGDYERNRILREIPENCEFLVPTYDVIPHKMFEVQEGLQAALLYNESKSSILQQVRDLVPLKKVQEVTIVSPFFDENGESLTTISQLCPNAKVKVLIQKNCTLPPCKLPQNKKIEFYDFNETKRGKAIFKTYDRQLHAKILHFKAYDTEYCIIGSANATIAGLGTLNKRGINEEFCVLYQSKDKDFLSQLGLKSRKKLDVSICELRRQDGDSTKWSNKVSILSAQYELGNIIISCNETLSDGALLAVDNGIKIDEYEINPGANGRYEIEIKLDKDKQYICYLINNDKNRISNKSFINWPEQLASTNPSKTSRTLNRFISQIENEGYKGLEIAGMLSEVMWDLANVTADSVLPKIQASSGNNRNADSLPDLKYNPAYDNDDTERGRTKQIDRTSRLIECIEESIRMKIRALDDEIIDEEEEGTAEESNNREYEAQDDVIIDEEDIEGYGELSTSVLTNFQTMIRKRFEQARITGDNVVTKDDLNLFSLSIFAAMEVCYLNRHSYNFDEIGSQDKSICQKRLYDSLDHSISYVGLDTIEYFVKFCDKMKKDTLLLLSDEDYNKVACRTMKYVILYGTLFYRYTNCNELPVKSNRLMKAITSLKSIFGAPTIDYLSRELEPLSERYDYVFRIEHVEKLLTDILKE